MASFDECDDKAECLSISVQGIGADVMCPTVLRLRKERIKEAETLGNTLDWYKYYTAFQKLTGKEFDDWSE